MIITFNLKTKTMKKENTYIAPPLGIIIKWWKSKGNPEAKSGSFNYDLYLQYLQAINK
jgi:hypothetical protein